jgi:hypothetical protein
MKAQLFCGFQLLPQLRHVHNIAQPHGTRTIEQSEGGMNGRKALPDELQHQQFVEIGIQQRTRNWIEFPIMVMRAPGEVDNHNSSTLIECPAIVPVH